MSQKRDIKYKTCLMHTCCPKCGVNIYDKDMSLKCSKCRDLYCKSHLCNGQCINCYYRMEYKAKRSAMQIALNKNRNFYHEVIIKWITEYCMGFTCNCCNIECGKEICINNGWDFKLKKDCDNKNIYYYSPKYPIKNVMIVNIEKNKYRIFCNQCVETKVVTKCPVVTDLQSWSYRDEECNNYEMKNGERKRVRCGAHARVLNVIKVLTGYKGIANPKCDDCGNPYCDKHIWEKRCQQCWQDMEFKRYYDAVKYALRMMGEDVFCQDVFVKMIVDYCVGYRLRCGTKAYSLIAFYIPKDCDNEIVINNEGQFYMERGSTGDKMFMFYKKYLVDRSVQVYSEHGYAICGECTQKYGVSK